MTATPLPRLAWRTVTGSKNPKWAVKGTVRAAAYYGDAHRFLIEEVYSPGWGEFGTLYQVRDAFTVTDADLRAGKSSQVVFHSGEFEKIIEFCDKALAL